MPNELLSLLHILASVVWVGGMFFAHFCLRPVAFSQLEPPQRLRLWHGVFARFFPWVWVAIVLLILSGKGLIGAMGGAGAVPSYLHAMAGIGYLMAIIFAVIFFIPWRQMRKAVAAENWLAAASALGRIRLLVLTNLVLGLINIAMIFVVPMF